ncbi:hypothetical protein BH23GEM2_BH23GEM2_25730 [soil metagenome]
MSLRMQRTVLLSVALLAAACTAGQNDTVPQRSGSAVDIVARGLQFEAPDEIESGWTTFRFRNESAMMHFALLQRLPTGIGISEQQRLVAPVFQEGMNLLNAGETDAAMQKFGELPEWFGQVVFTGGPGLLSPGRTSETSVYLEPGTYLIECYVKTNGIFHSYNPDSLAYGMVHQLTVTPAESDATAPEPTLALTISGEGGIRMAGDVDAGEHTVSVRFADQRAHENFVGHDVHLVRLADTADMSRVAAWMDWTQRTGLDTPAPAEFLGGVNEMPAGAIGYFTASLEPGRYAWVAEVPNPQEKGMLQMFEVTAGSGDTAR